MQDELAKWSALLSIREVVNTVLEKARTAKLIGSSLEAAVVIHVADASIAQWLQQSNAAANGADELRYTLIVSQVSIADTAEDVLATASHSERVESATAGVIAVGVSRAGGKKCARCWNYSSHVGEAAGHHDLCERCTPVIQDLGFELPAAETPAQVSVPA